jgi:hypothetical protein
MSVTLLVACVPLGEQPRVQAADETLINAAIERAVEGLKKMQTSSGTFPYMMAGFGGDKEVGCTALVGLALLEADVPPSDPMVAGAVNAVTRAAPGLTETYSLAAAIMFLDKYGDKKGGAAYTGLIGGMAQKLLKGQGKDGGWSYGGTGNQFFNDNSNTQFAILALWVARKHKMNVESALLLAEQRFRKSQGQLGGWSYGQTNAPNGDPETETMTCAGLLGLFLGFGTAKEKVANIKAGAGGAGDDAAGAPPKIDLKDIRNDPAVAKAMSFIGRSVGGNLQGAGHWLYFLWSLERVCVTYDFKDVNGIDWYDWGSKILLFYQGKNGLWSADHGACADTAFAMLFLKKANLVGKIADLRSGTGARPPASGGAKPGTGATTKNEAATPSDKLAQDLIKASTAKQSQMIDEYKAAKSQDYTYALAAALPKLSAGAQDKARLALVERLETKTVGTLRQYMEQDDRELRLAATVAAGRKGKDEIAPDLIRLMKDKDKAVADAAYDSLKSVSGKNLDKDPAAWEAWWKAKANR